MALRTPLYLIIAALGVLIFVATFLPWATVDTANAPLADGIVDSSSGLEAGGWGAAAIVVGIAIAAIGVLGYVWNPFSDPEAMFIAGFAVLALIAAGIKLGDANDLVGTEIVDYYDASAGIGLYLILVAANLALLGSLWILFSRPKAEARLAD